MSKTVKVTTVGSSIGIILPKELLERLHVEQGDTLYVTETPGGLQLSPYNPDFEAAIEAGRRVMSQYRNALQRLAE